MYLRVSYDDEFEDLIMYLRSKYGKEMFDLDGIGEQTDMSKFSKRFFSSKTTADASIDANANVDDVSVIAYNTELPKPFFRLNSYYILWKELKRLYGLQTANEIIEMQLSGDIYINDFHGVASGEPYCFNYSTYDIMTKGLPMVKKIISSPPKYLYAFKSQLEQFTVIASNSTLGATGLADLLIVMSYYVKNILETKSDAHFTFASEEDCWRYVKENIVSFIYTINQPMRANQSPFTNISVYDKYFLEKLCNDYLFPDGSTPDINIIQKLQKIYLDTMNEELKRTPVTFPVTTACFSIDEDKNIQDLEFAKFIAEENLEFGFINIYCGDSSTLSSCCRLRSEQKSEYFNSFGSGSSKIGSLGVCTINLPRLAIKSKTQEEFLRQLPLYVEVCARINNAKRHIVKKRIDNGNLPLYTFGFMELSKQYSTTGINGLNECVEILGVDILNNDGQQFVFDVMKVINENNNKFEKLYNAPHNAEQIPGENVSIKIASKDKLLKYQDTYNLYSNQFIPLTTNADMLDRIKLQGLFDKHFSGGSICHINIETTIKNVDYIVDLIKSCAKMGVIYWALNYNLQKCKNSHMSVGKNNVCPICGEEITDNFTRVVGFLTNTKNWHKVRREEDYPNRQFYKV
jgi:ribonucleoside-triphosphate reductase